MVRERLVVRVRSAAAVALFALVAAGCARQQAAPAGLTDADRAAIDAARAAVEAAANANDFDTWTAHYADDAVLLQPNGPALTGKAAITESMKQFPPLSGVKFTHTSVDGAGDLAWAQGTYELTMTPPGAAAISDRGKFIEIWRKGADGAWKVSRDIYNSDLPMPAPPAAAKP